MQEGKMGKKGKWLASVKNAFKSPIRAGDDEESESKDMNLFGDTRPVAVIPDKPKRKARRWSYGKVALSEDKEPDIKEVVTQTETSVQSNSKFTMFMYPSQEEWAAVIVQTAFRGHLARRTLRALRGLVRLQAFVRSRRVMRQANTTMRTVQAITRVQGRLRTHQARMSEDGLAVQHQVWQKSQPIIRKESEWLTETGWNDSNLSAQQIEAKEQERQVAALKRERAMAYARTQQLRRAGPKQVVPLFIECEPDKPHWRWSYVERWTAARPWQNRMFEIPPAFKDVPDDQTSKSVDVNAARKVPKRMSLAVSPQVRASCNDFANAHPKAHTGALRTSQVLNSRGTPHRSKSGAGSPRSRCSSDHLDDRGGSGSEFSATGRSTASILTDPKDGTRHSNTIHVGNGAIVDAEVEPLPTVAGHLQQTQGVKNKAGARSQPKPRLTAPGAFKTPATMKRLTYPKRDPRNLKHSAQPDPKSDKSSRSKGGVIPGSHQHI
ncbi:protein IQ-DOMAIN 5 isoform X2 [Physcomitrium patens]|uniref:DUF4005 domain-containing protein n=2 Tax=Physcomitrium patens TaxID=3218 RepID=A0A7I4C3V2_PHYPA|nr:protein IQ-DOMAIN 1-like isoform X2 [Physcomitrium patens]|eukprot:XP_024359654.1 protein IQ-DOMAIN 1-like isoform X2 [Physcomitrella patens]